MPNILLIEDNVDYAQHVIDLLHNAQTAKVYYHIQHVTSMQAALEQLADLHKFDLVLSNITLPDSRGKQTVQTISKISNDLPLLFITDQNIEALAVSAIKHGAQDYLVKGKHDGDALTRAIRYAIERQRYRGALRQALNETQAVQQQARLLSDQKRQLQELNRAKDDFISLASHQLRTPATAVKQYLALLLEGHFGDMDPRVYQLLSSAAASNERQLIVINDLLKTAQLDAGNYAIKPLAIDVTDLIRETIANLKPLFVAKQQTVTFANTSPVTACVDRAELRLVLENILENASKYSATNTTVAIDVAKRGRWVSIHISDEGVGIAPANQKRIFEKFTRVDNALSDTVTGSGLGLHIAKRIMRLHGGSISVKSEPHMGSTFTLKVPV